MVPSPNSGGLVIDHLDANAARSHFKYIIDKILTMRPSLDALRYMEVDSIEIGRDTDHDWTDTFVEEFRKRRGYDPIPYLPALMGKSFSDELLTSRFRQDYRVALHAAGLLRLRHDLLELRRFKPVNS